MDVVKVMGGLGNQMFQYAFARALSFDNKSVKLDVSYYNNQPPKNTVRKYELNLFPIVLDTTYSGKVFQKLDKIRELADLALRRIGIKDALCVYDSRLYNDNVYRYFHKYFIGYWQSDKYFHHIRKDLLREFDFPKDRLKGNRVILQKEILCCENSVAVHVRGGDYLNDDNVGRLGNVCARDYYSRAMKYMINRNIGKNCKFYLFTNDEQYAESLIGSMANYDVRLVCEDVNNESWIDMYLMSICKHNIIANSTYSWWGAWLNVNKDKIVIAPKKWSKAIENEDIYVEGWIKM